MNIDRRQFFAGSAAVLGSLAAGGCNIVAANKVDAAKSSHRSDRKRTLRLAHMTDIHLNEERNAERGFQAALEHIHNLDDPPELIVTGGDLIMDALDKDAQAAHAQWDLFDAVLSRHCQIPVKHCLGNHDGWGLYLDESSRKGEDPSMDMAIERLGLPGRYYSYEVGGWKFIHLDSTRMQTQKKSYLAKLDDEQYEWLNQQLASSDGRPVVIISHIPIVSATVFLYEDTAKETELIVPGACMHLDSGGLLGMFKDRPNVKLALSGHMHLIDRVDIRQTSFICDGAVSGSWWQGDYHGFEEGYGLIDLYDDGSFEHQYVAYNWKV
ncbi:MAG: metallophosphoesterase family protein, partial [Planctomycetota bacterium]